MIVQMQVFGLPKDAEGLGTLRQELTEDADSLGIHESLVNLVDDLLPVGICSNLVVNLVYFGAYPSGSMDALNMSLQCKVLATIDRYIQLHKHLFDPPTRLNFTYRYQPSTETVNV
jgi:hypothetical protein